MPPTARGPVGLRVEWATRSRVGRRPRARVVDGPSLSPSGHRALPADRDARPAGRPVTDVPTSVRRPDDRVGDRQSETGTIGRLGRTVEAVQDPFALGGWDARARVVDRQADAGAPGGDRHPPPPPPPG